jgi:glycerate 2-kinase
MHPRQLLLHCFQAALEAVDARRCVQRELARRPAAGTWHLIGVGKAAAAMAQGAHEALGSRLAGGCLVLPADHVPRGFEPQSHGIEVHHGAHPLPDAASLAAGEALAAFVSRLPADARILWLVSGGASSLVERPLPGISLDDLRTASDWAMSSGAPIDLVNGLRRRLSTLKGGGLARLAGARRMRCLMLSDVPGDDPRVVGSGLLHASPDDGLDERLDAALTPELRALLHRSSRHRPAPGATPPVPVAVVASLRLACAAAAQAATGQGCGARIVRRRFAGDAALLGRRFATALARLPPGVVQVRGGESTVRLPARPGRGGRNQHLALAAAREFERRGLERATLLAAGTDGIDGNSDDAGAIVDAGTCRRGRDDGSDPEQSLRVADSGTFLEAAGDLLHTGPTLTNVGDLVLAVRGEVER